MPARDRPTRAGETVTCTGAGTADPGQYANLGTVTALDPFSVELTDADPSHYFGSAPSVDIEKPQTGRTPTRRPVRSCRSATRSAWTYDVTNTGNVPLTDVIVVDDQGVVVELPAGHPRGR